MKKQKQHQKQHSDAKAKTHNVESHNQKGGITAAEVNNGKPADDGVKMIQIQPFKEDDCFLRARKLFAMMGIEDIGNRAVQMAEMIDVYRKIDQGLIPNPKKKLTDQPKKKKA